MPPFLGTLPPGVRAQLGLGLQIATGLACFAGLGYWVDRKRGGGFLFTVVGSAVGILYAGYEIWKAARQLSVEAGKKGPAADQR